MMSRSPLRALEIGMTATKQRAGGVDRYYFNLLKSLPSVGIDVRGLVVGNADDQAGEQPAIESFAPEDASMLRRWRSLRAMVPSRAAQSDLVVSHFAPYAFPVLDTFVKRPFVNHFHGPWALESAANGAHPLKVAVRRIVERIVYARASRFIVLSHAFADILTNEYRVPSTKVSVVPGGVDLRRFVALGSRDEARARLGLPTGRPMIATVRRLVPAKGLENLVASTEIIARAVPDVAIVIVGTGPLAKRLQQMIVERALERTVYLIGHVSEDLLPSVYRAADLFVVPTLTLEGFGLVVVESLACGTPALVTPVGGLPEVVRGLDPALVLRGSAPADLADGIARALTGDQTLPSSEACIAYARRFAWDRIAAQVGDVYRDVVATQ